MNMKFVGTFHSLDSSWMSFGPNLPCCTTNSISNRLGTRGSRVGQEVPGKPHEYREGPRDKSRPRSPRWPGRRALLTFKRMLPMPFEARDP